MGITILIMGTIVTVLKLTRRERKNVYGVVDSLRSGWKTTAESVG
jgi:hypothetical protein